MQARRGGHYDFLILGLTASCLLSGQSTAFSFNGMPIEPAPLLNARRRPPRLIELAPLSSARRRPPRFSISRGLRSSASTSDDDPEEEKEGLVFNLDGLSRRIRDMEEQESERAEVNAEKLAKSLQRRVKEVRVADAAEARVMRSFTTDTDSTAVSLPVVAFDALLPGQRLTGSTEDPTFCRLLRDLGLGGLFVMVSWDPFKRKVRRNGVICRIAFVDALKQPPQPSCPLSSSDLSAIPSSVDFILVGRQPCHVVGPAQGMMARVGRWRREYDPEGEEKVLGWGDERILDVEQPGGSKNRLAGADSAIERALRAAASLAALERREKARADESTALEPAALPCTQWSLCQVQCEEEKAATRDEVALAESLVPLLDRWLALASDPRTYDNTNVTASTRARRNEPGLRCDPQQRMALVLHDLGERPPPTRPTAFAFWGGALINPLPPLGVSLEIRGRMLEAPTGLDKLALLQTGLQRSIENLEGSRPL